MLLQSLKTIHHYFSHFRQAGSLFRGFNHPSYAEPPHQPKSIFSRFLDYLHLFFIVKMIPANYHLFQFDVKKRSCFNDYMDDPVAPLVKHKLYQCLWDDRYSMLVNDKYVFHCFCLYHAIPVPRLYGTCRNGIFENGGTHLKDIMAKDHIESVIIKPVSGTQGKGIYIMTNDTALSSLPGAFHKGTFIVQEVIKQHTTMHSINPFSVNTIRIITLLCPDGSVELLAAMLRTSSNQSPIDNFSSGGIVVGIDAQTGMLRERGFLKHPFGTTVTAHPLTNIVFRNFTIPFWDGIKAMVIKAQKIFRQLKSIGWDIAVTPGGPIMIEGNIEWGTAGLQAANGGLLTERNRKLFAQYGLHI